MRAKKCAAVYDAEGLAEAVALQEAGLIDGDIVLLLPADWQQAVKAVNETSSWVMSVAEDALTAGRGETSRQLESLLAYCDQNAVSDCHLTAGQNALQVSVRSQGLLRPYLKLDRCSGLGLCRALRQRAGLNLETLTMPIDGTLKAFGKKIRLAATPSIAGESVTLRWPGKKSAVRSPDELGLSDTQIELVTSSVGRKLNGLVIVSGGVGAGKTTTLYFLMRFFRIRQKNRYSGRPGGMLGTGMDPDGYEHHFCQKQTCIPAGSFAPKS
ncbi:MAG: Flp pilus assembly complex ATPase component TadA [Verrucomicrobia bacterium]|nr:Flp pilus assembly complex ATPase component TadA [Verrucomicrobiota bacterium]